MRVDTLEDAEDCSLNEVFGFIVRAFIHSAAQLTDYELDYGTAKHLGNGRHEQLLSMAQAAGLLTRPKGKGRARVWKLVDDPKFVHIFTRDETAWNQQRDRDRKNTALTIPVRLRDGDLCRRCGLVVTPGDQWSGRGLTYDHQTPGQAATVDTYFVCCRSCNSARQNRSEAESPRPLLPAPAQPYYHPKTVEILARHGHTVISGPPPDEKGKTASDRSPTKKRANSPKAKGGTRVGTGRGGTGRTGPNRAGGARDGPP